MIRHAGFFCSWAFITISITFIKVSITLCLWWLFCSSLTVTFQPVKMDHVYENGFLFFYFNWLPMSNLRKRIGATGKRGKKWACLFFSFPVFWDQSQNSQKKVRIPTLISEFWLFSENSNFFLRKKVSFIRILKRIWQKCD